MKRAQHHLEAGTQQQKVYGLALLVLLCSDHSDKPMPHFRMPLTLRGLSNTIILFSANEIVSRTLLN